MRNEKRKALKRKKQEADEAEEDDEVKEINIDKEQILEKFEKGQYDLSIHFSKRLAFEMNLQTKLRSVITQQGKSKKDQQNIEIFAAFHSNQIHQFNYDLSLKKKENIMPKLTKTFGELESHKLAIRSI